MSIREERIASGLYSQCGEPSLGYTLCERHRHLKAESAKAARSKRKTLGQCYQCQLPAAPGTVRCVAHNAKRTLSKLIKKRQMIADGRCFKCGVESPNFKSCEKCRDKMKRLLLKIKKEVIGHYGGKCACPACNETDIRFLTMDHIDGNGNQHRKKIRRTIYRWLKTNKYPSGFQVLCFSCNSGRAMNNGICPHLDGYRSFINIYEKFE